MRLPPRPPARSGRAARRPLPGGTTIRTPPPWQATRYRLAKLARDPGALSVFGAIWLLYSAIRALGDEIGLLDISTAVLQVDRWLGFGATTPERLQSAAYQAGSIGWLEYLALAVHLSYFLVPFAAGVGLWFLSRERDGGREFVDYVAATALVLYTGVALNLLFPTAPPWLQSEAVAGMDVDRAMPRAIAALGQTWLESAVDADPNPRAAMPSLHVGITALVAIELWRHHRSAGLVTAIYTLAMSLALIYMGEHYLIDALVGILLAAFGRVGVRAGWPYMLVSRLIGWLPAGRIRAVWRDSG